MDGTKDEFVLYVDGEVIEMRERDNHVTLGLTGLKFEDFTEALWWYLDYYDLWVSV